MDSRQKHAGMTTLEAVSWCHSLLSPYRPFGPYGDRPFGLVAFRQVSLYCIIGTLTIVNIPETQMKNAALALALTVLCSLTPVFAAPSSELARVANGLSFDRILNQLTDEYYKGLQMPAAPAPLDRQSSPADRFWITAYAANPASAPCSWAGLEIAAAKGTRFPARCADGYPPSPLKAWSGMPPFPISRLL